ncbi:MAG: dNTP triphosphohydrolase [Chloroflexi bacterium]|nr:dNTP triphosphohydrolase [Chloroflexota bacterium]
MLSHHVRLRLEQREESLSPYAIRVCASQGRAIPEAPSPLRTDFQRDRDRIIHSKAFRRLKHKTQVFIAPLGDHFVTRLTHTLEVSQIARTIARALNLNEDLEEAITLGHDLGHTPFGHIGEETLDQLAPTGFAHAPQSLRIVDTLEKDGQGLNLTWEVRQGILSHSKPQGDFLDSALPKNLTLEAQVCRLADAVAYLNHDIGDAVRAGLLREDDLPSSVTALLGPGHAQRIDALVTDVVEASWVRAFMFERVYLPTSHNPQGQKAREIVAFLYGYYTAHPDQIPQEYWRREEPPKRMALDYLSGMTDHYALRVAEELCPGISGGVFGWVV